MVDGELLVLEILIFMRQPCTTKNCLHPPNCKALLEIKSARSITVGWSSRECGVEKD